MNLLKPEHNQLLNQVASMVLKPSPVREKVFNDTEFIKHTEEYFMLDYVPTTQVVAQMVDWQSEPKNVIPIPTPPPISVKVHRFFESYAVSVYDIEPFLSSQNAYYRAVEQLAANKFKLAMPREGIDALEMFRKTKIANIGLQFAMRYDNHRVAFENSLLSTGAYTYADPTLSAIKTEFKFLSQTAVKTWNDLDNATPLTDIEEALQKFQNNKLTVGAIFMGRTAANNFIKNKKEIINQAVSVQGASVIVQSPEIELSKNKIYDPFAGYQEIGNYKGIPIYMISKEVEVPTPNGKTVMVETFDTNAVSFVALNDILYNRNFFVVHRELNYMDEDSGKMDTKKEEMVSYFGKVDDTQKRVNFYCESTFAPVMTNPNALLILNVA